MGCGCNKKKPQLPKEVEEKQAILVKAIARPILVEIKINPINSKVRFFKKFVTLFKKFVFISNRFTYFLPFL